MAAYTCAATMTAVCTIWLKWRKTSEIPEMIRPKEEGVPEWNLR